MAAALFDKLVKNKTNIRRAEGYDKLVMKVLLIERKNYRNLKFNIHNIKTHFANISDR